MGKRGRGEEGKRRDGRLMAWKSVREGEKKRGKH